MSRESANAHRLAERASRSSGRPALILGGSIGSHRAPSRPRRSGADDNLDGRRMPCLDDNRYRPGWGRIRGCARRCRHVILAGWQCDAKAPVRVTRRARHDTAARRPHADRSASHRRELAGRHGILYRTRPPRQHLPRKLTICRCVLSSHCRAYDCARGTWDGLRAACGHRATRRRAPKDRQEKRSGQASDNRSRRTCAHAPLLAPWQIMTLLRAT